MFLSQAPEVQPHWFHEDELSDGVIFLGVDAHQAAYYERKYANKLLGSPEVGAKFVIVSIDTPPTFIKPDWKNWLNVGRKRQTLKTLLEMLSLPYGSEIPLFECVFLLCFF